MRPFEPFNLVGADALHQTDAVLDRVPRQVPVALHALPVDVQRLEAQLRAGAHRPVMASVPAAAGDEVVVARV
ncbi:hypothetical protein D3C76_1408760 [compost metagenome]